MKQYDLVVIGGGRGGLSVAISAYDNGVKNILVLEKEDYLGWKLLKVEETNEYVNDEDDEFPSYHYENDIDWLKEAYCAMGGDPENYRGGDSLDNIMDYQGY